MKTQLVTSAALAAVCTLQLPAMGEAEKNEKEIKDGKPAFEMPEFEASLDFCSRQLTYGLADNLDPIITPGVEGEWHGFFLEAMALFDTTRWGLKNGGYGDRAWKYQELDFGPGYDYTFQADDWKYLPTSIELGGNWMYEYHPRVDKAKGYSNPDTQFVNLWGSLPDLWLDPSLSVELDTVRDKGVYFNASIDHTFTLISAKEKDEDNLLGLNVKLAQGLGNSSRNEEDVGVDMWALKDASATLTLDWKVASWLTVSPYAAFYEQVMRKIRDEARYYSVEDEKHSSYQFIGGITLTANF